MTNNLRHHILFLYMTGCTILYLIAGFINMWLKAVPIELIQLTWVLALTLALNKQVGDKICVLYDRLKGKSFEGEL